MKTSWNDLRLMEACLTGQATAADRALMEARMLVQPQLREEMYWQKETYDIIREYGRQQLRREIEQVHQALFTHPQHRSFREKIIGFFKG